MFLTKILSGIVNINKENKGVDCKGESIDIRKYMEVRSPDIIINSPKYGHLDNEITKAVDDDNIIRKVGSIFRRNGYELDIEMGGPFVAKDKNLRIYYAKTFTHYDDYSYNDEHYAFSISEETAVKIVEAVKTQIKKVYGNNGIYLYATEEIDEESLKHKFEYYRELTLEDKKRIHELAAKGINCPGISIKLNTSPEKVEKCLGVYTDRIKPANPLLGDNS